MDKTKTKEKSAETESDYEFDSDMSDMISAAIAKKKENREAEKKSKKKKYIAIYASSVVLILGAAYFAGWAGSMGKFLPNTYINNIPVGGMNVVQATAAVKETSPEQCLHIKGRNDTDERIDLIEFGYQQDIYSEVKALFDGENHAAWIASSFKNTDYTVDTLPQYDSKQLQKLLKNRIWGSEETADARLEYGSDGYYIKPEVYGDIPDLDKLAEYVDGEVAKGNLLIDLEQSGCYSDPQVFSTDLTGTLEEVKSKFNFVITYDFDYTKEVLTGADVFGWMGSDGKIDRSKAEKYIDRLADRYDTFMTTRHFKSTARGTIDFKQERYSTGQYGWWMDREKTVDKLLGYIEAGESVTIDPVYVKLEDTGYTYEGFESGRSANGDIGDTYIEVDLSAQHLWYYEKGELKFETGNIVSGKASDPKRKTPPGVYSVYAKNTNYTMRAADGSYTAKCQYFMRISFEGIGFHDLSRSAYGGNIYLTNGSHGCMNMKLDEVKQLYEMVEWGTPAILYY